METRNLSNGRLEVWTDAGHVIRKIGNSNPTDVRRRRVSADELDQWEEITVEEAERAKRLAENEAHYRSIVSARIRSRYDLDAELAILRQRDSKPEEFAAYSAYAEECKAAVKAEINTESDLADVVDELSSEEGVGDE